MKKEKKIENVPVKWFILLPLLGVAHKVLELSGWLEQGGWLSFLLFLGLPLLWLVIILKETSVPFSPLVWIGSLYGLLVGLIELIYWINFRNPLGLEETGWSFEDLLTAIEYYLRPGAMFLGNLLLGVLLGVLTGFTATMIVRFQRKKR